MVSYKLKENVEKQILYEGVHVMYDRMLLHVIFDQLPFQFFHDISAFTHLKGCDHCFPGFHTALQELTIKLHFAGPQPLVLVINLDFLVTISNLVRLQWQLRIQLQYGINSFSKEKCVTKQSQKIISENLVQWKCGLNSRGTYKAMSRAWISPMQPCKLPYRWWQIMMGETCTF